MDIWLTVLNGLSYGLLLFMLSAGLTLIFGLMGVLNFAHAALYMLGAYVGYSLTQSLGFAMALWLAPALVGLLGAGFQHGVLRPMQSRGHVAELLVTFGLAYVLTELVQLLWGRAPLPFKSTAWLDGTALTIATTSDGWQLHWGLWAGCAADEVSCARYPASRAFVAVVALAMWALMALIMRSTRVGWVIRAAVTHPHMVQALGHDVPRIYRWVFGVGCGLAALAGVVGGSTFVTEPSMAMTLGPLAFVVVVLGGVGSLTGALVASLLIGLLQTAVVAWPHTAVSVWAPVLPFALLVAVLLFKPSGLLGREWR
jgi:branched-chain amino acid transport system permease protein